LQYYDLITMQHQQWLNFTAKKWYLVVKP